MKRFFYILFILNILCFGNIVAQQNKGKLPEWLKIEESKISKDSILIGDQVVLSTIFSIPQDQSLSFVPYTETLKLYANKEKTPDESLYDDASKIEVVKDFKIDTLAVKKGIREIEAKLLLTCFDSGYYKLPDVLAVTKGGDTIYLNAPKLEVSNIQIDTTTFKLRDLKNQINYPVTLKEVLTMVGYAFGIILFIIAIIILIIIIIRRRKNQTIFGKPKVIDPPHIIALRELDKIRNEKLWQNGKEKIFYTNVTEVLREYIEKRFKVSAMEKTSAEILDSLTDKHIEAKPYNELKNLFDVADLVKFAKYTPAINENEEVIPVAVRFVNSTFMQELEEKKIISPEENINKPQNTIAEEVNKKEEV